MPTFEELDRKYLGQAKDPFEELDRKYLGQEKGLEALPYQGSQKLYTTEKELPSFLQSDMGRQALQSLYDSIIGKGLRATGHVPELAAEERAPSPEGTLETLARQGPGLLTDLPFYALPGGLATKAGAGPILSTATAFGVPDSIREYLRQTLEDEAISPRNIVKEGVKGAALGTALGAVGELPVRPALKFPVETGVFAEAQALEEGKTVPTPEQAIISGIFLGHFKAFNAALDYIGKQTGKAPAEVQMDVAQEAQATGKSEQQVLADKIRSLPEATPEELEGVKRFGQGEGEEVKKRIRKILEETPGTLKPIPEKGVERVEPQKAQEKVIEPIPPASEGRPSQPEPDIIGSGAKTLQAGAGEAQPLFPQQEPFKFDPNSTANEGRWRLKDPDLFTDYFRRKSSTPGISYVMGKNEETGKIEPQAIRFDKKVVSEEEASKWWEANKSRFERTWTWQQPTKAGEAQPTGGVEGAKGDFGPIFTEFRGRPKEAIEHLLRVKDGEAVGALYHKEIGDIDLVWGKEGNPEKNYEDGYGLAKIARKHPEILNNLQEIILPMKVKSQSKNRVILESSDHKAVVSLDWYGKEKKWLLSTYRKLGPSRTEGSIYGFSDKDVPTPTPRGGSKENIPPSQGEVKPEEPTLSGGRPGVFPESLASAFRRAEDALQGGNVGEFLRFSKEVTGMAERLIREPKLPPGVQEQVKGDLSGISRWWHKTFGTPARVARQFPQFKPIYEAARDGHLATDEMISRFAPIINEVDALSQKELEGLGKALFDGTQSNRVFTTAELQARGLSQEAITTYQNVRKTLNGIYGEMKKLFIDLGASSEVPPPLEGYFPLKRFGRFYIEVRDKTGNLVSFETAENGRERNALSNNTRKQFPTDKFEVNIGKMSNAQFEYFRDLDPGTLSLLSKFARVEADVRDPFIKQVLEYLKLRGFKQHFAHREGIPGFSKDVPRVLSSYIVGVSGYINRLRSLTEMRKAAENIDTRANPELANFTADYINYIARPGSEAGGLRSFLFMWYLGGNVKSAMLNATQPITTTYPYLTRYANDIRVAKEMTKASALAIKPTKSLDPDLSKALAEATREGIVSEQLVFELRGRAKGATLAKSGTYWQALRAVSYLFGSAEKFNRRVTFIAAYNLARAGKGPADMTPEAFARQAVIDTQFEYGRFNRPPLGRGAVGATLLTFKTFIINYLELVWDAPPAQKARLMAVLAGLAGISGLPFADDIRDGFEFVARKFGYPLDVKKEFTDFLTGITGDPTRAEVIMSGVTRLTPFDLGRSIGMADIIPAASLKGFGGPLGGTIARAEPALGAYQRGRSGEALEALTPEAIRNVLMARRFKEEGARDVEGRLIHRPTTAEIAGKALGFQPSGLSRAQELRETERKTIGFKSEQTQIFYDRLSRAIFDKDGAERTQVLQDLRDYNSKIAPAYRIKIDPATLQRRLQEMRLDERLAGIRRLPKSARREALERRLEYSQ